MSRFAKTHFKIINSTSTYAKENASLLDLPALITADEQTSGRGRRGNSFYSPKDTGLYMTLLIPAPTNCELLTPAAAVAVCKELEKLGAKPKIKWVNDVFVSGKKVCGILTELFEKDGRYYVAIGIGINLTTADFPSELTSAGSVGIECIKAELSEKIAESIVDYVNKPNPQNIIDEYRNRFFIIGKNITYWKNNIEFSAVAVGINESCNLIVKLSDGSTDVLSSGEISIKF